MSFFFETILIPFWVIVFIFASAAPLWFKWFNQFYKKYIVTGILKKRFWRAKSAAEMKMDVLKKATEHWTATSELSAYSDSGGKKSKAGKKNIDPVKKQNIRTVLKVLAEAGEAGILPKSITDKAKINNVDTASALKYLVEKEFSEITTSALGAKYYLTRLGRKYCINKKIIADS